MQKTMRRQMRYAMLFVGAMQVCSMGAMTLFVDSYTVKDVTAFSDNGTSQVIVPAQQWVLSNLVYGPDGYLFAVVHTEDEVVRFDLADPSTCITVVQKDSGELKGPAGLAFGELGGQTYMYVVNNEDSSVVRYSYDCVSGQVSGGAVFVTSGSGGLSWPRGIAVRAQDGDLYVASPGRGQVLHYDGDNGAPLGAVPIPSGCLAYPVYVTFNRAEDVLYVANLHAGVIAYDMTDQTCQEIVTTAMIAEPQGLVLAWDGHLYIAGGASHNIVSWDGSTAAVFASGLNTPLSLAFGPMNESPVAVCHDVELSAGANCQALVAPDLLGGDSYDPDGDAITLSLDPPGPYPLGETTVTLTATDPSGATSQCTATVTVIDTEAPVIEVPDEPIVLWPPNHKYATIDVADMVADAWDNCTPLTVENVVISGVTSDEAEDIRGNGDGRTKDDIVIAEDCRSVAVRRERQGGGNGRVYCIHLCLCDAEGNMGIGAVEVHVPHDKKGQAIDDGPVYGVVGCAESVPAGQG